MENATLKQEYQDQRTINLTLQQSLFQYKAKINELSDLIIRLTETDRSGNDALSMMATSKQDFKNKYLEQVEMNTKLETEVD